MRSTPHGTSRIPLLPGSALHLAAVLVLFAAWPGRAEAGWKAGWSYRRSVTIDHTKVSGASDLTNFPLMVTTTDAALKTVANGGKVQHAQGYDIVFTNADGTTLLSHEIEKYDATTGELVVWVKIPTLKVASDTLIFMYYGNASYSTAPSSTAVWDSNYKGVWHLPDATATTVADSTANVKTGTKASSGNPAEASGKVGQGQDFSSDNVAIGSLGVANSFTMEAWIKADTLSGSGDYSTYGFTVMASSAAAGSYSWLAARGSEVRLWAYETNTGLYGQTSGANLTTGAWYHIVATATKGSTSKVYVNGVERLSFTNSGSANWTTACCIGDLRPGRAIYFDGVIDEVRVSDSVRSADWIAFEYHNVSDAGNCLTLGAEAAVRYWVGGDGDWSDAANHWASSSGGTPGASYLPSSTDCACFDSNSGSGTCTVNQAVDVFGLLLDSGSNVTVSQGANAVTVGADGIEVKGQTFSGGSSGIAVSGSVTLSGGSFTSTSGTLSVGGDFSNSTGTLAHNNGTVAFTGSAAQTVTTGGVAAAKTFYDVYVDNTAGTPGDAADVDTTGAIKVDGTLTVHDGQFQPETGSDFVNVTVEADGILKPDSGATIAVSGDWDNTNGTFTHNGGRVDFDGSGAQAVTTGGTAAAKAFNNVYVNNTAGTPGDAADVDTTGAIKVDGTLTVHDGQFQPETGSDFAHVSIDAASGILKPDASAAVTVSGNWTSSGTFTHNSGRVELDGGSAQTVNTGGTGAGKNFFDLKVNKSANTASLASNIGISGAIAVSQGELDCLTFSITTTNGYNLTVDGGALSLGSATHEIKGGWAYTAGTIDAETSTVRFWIPYTGMTAATVSGTFALNNATFYVWQAGVSATYSISINASLTVNGTLTMQGYDTGGWHTYYNGSGAIYAKGAVVGNSKYCLMRLPLIEVNAAAGNQNITNFRFSGVSTTAGTPVFRVNKAAGDAVINGYCSFGAWSGGNYGYLQVDSPLTYAAGSTLEFAVGTNGNDHGRFYLTGASTVDTNDLVCTLPAGTGNNTIDLGGKTVTAYGDLSVSINYSSWGRYLNNGTIDVKGNYSLTLSTAGTSSSTVAIRLSGSADTTATYSGDTTAYFPGFVVAKDAGKKVALASNFYANRTGTDVTVSSGILDLAGYNLTVKDALTVAAAGTLKLLGSETVTATTETYDTAGATVWFYGGAGPYVVTGLATSYSNLKITGAGGTYQFAGGSTTTVSGTLTVQGTSGSNVLLRSAATPTKWAFSFPNGEQEVHYADVMDGECSDHDCYAYYSTNSGNNDDGEATPHWVFETAGIRYWVGGTGNWDDPTNHWALTSGGTPDAGNAPDATTIVKFDANSGGGTATINAAAAAYRFWMAAGVTTAVTQDTTNTLTVGNGGYRQEAGTFTGGSGAITVTGDWLLSGGTFASTSGLLKFDAPNAARSYQQTGGTFTHASGSVEFENFGATDTIAFTGQLYDVVLDLTGSGSACSMASAVDVLHNFAVNHQGGNLGEWNVYGDITAWDTNQPYGGTINFLGGNNTVWTVSNPGERFFNVSINKTGSLTITDDIEMHADGSFTHVAGDVTMPDTFSMYSGESRTQTVSAAGVVFNNVTVDMGGVASVLNAGTMNVNGNLLISRAVTINGTANLSGDLESNDADVSGTLAINCVGTGDQAVSCAGGEFGDGALTVNKPVSGTVSLAEAFSPASWSGAVNITAGTLDLAGYSVSTAGAFTVGAAGTLKLLGSETVTAATETYDTAGATVWFYGGAGPYVVTDLATSYSNLKLDGPGVTFQFAGGSTTTVGGTLTVVGTSGAKTLLRSAATPTKWAFSFPNGEQEVHYADVMDGECSDHDCYAYYSTNSGNNDDGEATPHWVFETAGIRYWVGGTGNWNDPTNHWALTSGGAPDAANAPDATTIVKFDANSGGGTLTINAAAAAYKFWMASGNTTSVTQDAANALTVDVGGMVVAAGTFTGGSGAITDGGDFCLSGGSFTSTSGMLSVGGSFAVTGGSFTHNGGTAAFTATSGTKTITSAAQPLYNATFGTAAGGTWQLQDALSVANDLTFAYGTFQTNDKSVTIGRDLLLQNTLAAAAFAAGGSTIQVGRHLRNNVNNGFSAGTSSVQMTGTGTLSQSNGCSIAFYDLKVAPDGGVTTFDGNNDQNQVTTVTHQCTTGTGTFANVNSHKFVILATTADAWLPNPACTWQVYFTYQLGAGSDFTYNLNPCVMQANLDIYRNSAGYAQTVALAAAFATTASISLRENQVTANDRVLNLNGFDLTVGGDLSTTARGFRIVVGSRTLSVAGNFTHGGFQAAGNIIAVDAGTIVVAGNFSHGGGGAAGQKIALANGSTFRVAGNWDTSAYAANALFNLTGTNLVKFDGDDAATVNCIAAESWPNVEVDGSLVTMQQNLTCQGLKLTSGSLDMNDFVLTVPYGAANKVDLVGGTVALGSATHEISGGWEYSGGTITPESSTVRFWLYTASPGPTISGTFSLANVTFQAGTVNDQNYYTNLTATLTVDGTLTLNGNELGYISDGMARIMGGGIVYAKGNIVGNGKTISGNLRLTVNGNGDQEQTNLSWSCSKNSARYLVDKPGGTFTWKTAMDFRSAWFAGSVDGNPQVQFNTPVLCEAGLPLTVEVTGYTNVTFAYGAGGGSGLTVGSLTVTLGRNSDGGTAWNLGGKTVVVTGTTTIRRTTCFNFVHNIDNGTLEMQGDLVFNQSGSNSITTGSATMTMTGSSDATVSSTGNTEVYSQSITINKDAGKKVSLATNLKLLGASTDLTVTQGVLDLAGRDLTLGRNLVVTDTLRLQGAETVTCAALDLQNGSTVEYNGTGTYAGFPATIGNAYRNLAFSGSGTWQPAAAVTVAEGLTMTAGTYEVLDTRSLTVTGNTALSGTATLRLDGGGTLGIGGGSTLSSAAGSTFQVAGAADKIAQIQNDGSGYYDLHLSGNVNVRYARIDDLAANCVTLDGAGTTTFDNVEFNDGEAAVGPYIKVLDSAWNSHNFTGMAFEDVGGGRQTILIDTQTGDSVTVTSYASGAGWLSGDDSDVDEADGGGELGNVLWAPTAADGLSASAEPAEKGTLVAWTAPVERGTLGYRVLRREAPAAGANAKPGEWQRLAEVPAAAFGGEPTGNEYRWLDESSGAAVSARYEYCVEEIEAGGEQPRSSSSSAN